MQATVYNMTFSREEFSHICYFLRQVYPDSIQMDNRLYLLEFPEDDIVRFYADIGRECTESEYNMTKIIGLCNTILAFRGKDRDRTKGIELLFEQCPIKSIHARYDSMIQEQMRQASAIDLIATADIVGPAGYVQGVYDTDRHLLWFEAGDGLDDADEPNTDQVYEWCLRQGVTYQAMRDTANDEIKRLCGADASLLDETTPPDSEETNHQ